MKTKNFLNVFYPKRLKCHVQKRETKKAEPVEKLNGGKYCLALEFEN